MAIVVVIMITIIENLKEIDIEIKDKIKAFTKENTTTEGNNMKIIKKEEILIDKMFNKSNKINFNNMAIHNKKEREETMKIRICKEQIK